MEAANTASIEIQKYVPQSGKKKGLLKYVGNITVEELRDAVTDHLERIGLSSKLDYLNLSADYQFMEATPEVPRYRWLAVFAVTGGSEGHYIHLAAIQNGQCQGLLIGKTFEGMDAALEIAAAITKFIGA